MSSDVSTSDQDARQAELVTCELEHSDLVAFVEKCKEDGVSVGEKITQLIQFFLAGGDNHLVNKSA